MGKVIDLTGETFGLLTVEELMPRRENGSALYRCRCTCSMAVYVNSVKLKRGYVKGCKNCAPSQYRKRPELLGKVFGDVTVVELAQREVGKNRRWRCICTCGEEVLRTTHQLLYEQNVCRHRHVEVTEDYLTTYITKRWRKTNDLTGERFGDLTVDERLDAQKNGEYLWRCHCVCGEEVLCTSRQLHNNKNVCRLNRIDDLTGQRFGYLMVEKLLPDKVKSGVLYQCRCDCGEIVRAASYQLKKGTVRGCDACAPSKWRKPQELTGKTFGDLTVIERVATSAASGRRWRCRCTCGAECIKTSHQLLHDGNLCKHVQSAKSAANTGKHLRFAAGEYKDRTGETYGDLTVVRALDERKNKEVVWLCRCVCGEEVKRTGTQLRTAKNLCRKKRVDDLTGQTFGLLTVEKLMDQRDEHYALYQCRCSCGNIVFANSKKLKRRTISACEKCAESRKHRPTIQIGERFGDLTVAELLDGEGHGRGRTWLCQCVCGEKVERTTKQLHCNRNTCRCSHKENTFFLNLAGKQINQLTVLEKLDKRDKKGSVMWRCLCSCGKECEYSADMLIHGNLVSCGCYRQKFLTGEQLMSGLHHVDGTCVEFLQRKKRSDNTTGYTGVYRTQNGKWKAGITLKGRRYHLGTYSDMADAIRARQRGEEMHDEFLDYYYKEHPEEANKRRRVKTTAWAEID